MKYDSEFREFLIRRRGGEFVIKRVSSLMAASFYRPQRVPESRYEIRRVEEGGQVFCFIKNIANGRILRLTERGFDLWSLMDGKTSLRSMAAGLFMKYGAFDFGEMRGLIRKLQTAGLIRADIPPLIRIQQFFSRFSHPLFGALAKWTIYLASINLSITQTDVKMRQLYRNTRRLFFSKIFLWVSVIGCCCMSFVFIRTFTHGSYDLRYFLDQPWKWFVSYFFLFLIAPVHELAHALTTQHYGYAVREIAFSLRFGCIPIFYADVTDIWMAPPSVRMKVAVAGPYSGWLLGSLAVLLALIIPQAMFILYLFALVCYLGVLVNLYPFVFMELDGYYILTDYLRMPYLMKQTFQVMRDLFTRGHFPARSRENFFSLIHAVFSLISVFMIIAFLVWCIYKGGHT